MRLLLLLLPLLPLLPLARRGQSSRVDVPGIHGKQFAVPPVSKEPRPEDCIPLLLRIPSDPRSGRVAGPVSERMAGGHYVNGVLSRARGMSGWDSVTTTRSEFADLVRRTQPVQTDLVWMAGQNGTGNWVPVYEIACERGTIEMRVALPRTLRDKVVIQQRIKPSSSSLHETGD